MEDSFPIAAVETPSIHLLEEFREKWQQELFSSGTNKSSAENKKTTKQKSWANEIIDDTIEITAEQSDEIKVLSLI